eukprot:723595-Pelagomonas_calceolata.AAC.2
MILVPCTARRAAQLLHQASGRQQATPKLTDEAHATELTDETRATELTDKAHATELTDETHATELTGNAHATELEGMPGRPQGMQRLIEEARSLGPC